MPASPLPPLPGAAAGLPAADQIAVAALPLAVVLGLGGDAARLGLGSFLGATGTALFVLAATATLPALAPAAPAAVGLLAARFGPAAGLAFASGCFALSLLAIGLAAARQRRAAAGSGPS
jgi:hypothetical protein